MLLGHTEWSHHDDDDDDDYVQSQNGFIAFKNKTRRKLDGLE